MKRLWKHSRPFAPAVFGSIILLLAMLLTRAPDFAGTGEAFALESAVFPLYVSPADSIVQPQRHLTIHSSRRRFAARLNSGGRPQRARIPSAINEPSKSHRRWQSTQMKAAIYNSPGGPDVLRYADAPDPVPAQRPHLGARQHEGQPLRAACSLDTVPIVVESGREPDVSEHENR